MKIIGTDNYARETIADFLVAENIKNKEFAELMCKALNEKYCNNDYAITFYKVVEDDFKLSKGMADFV